MGVPGSPTSLVTRDSGITIDNIPTPIWEEQLGRVIRVCLPPDCFCMICMSYCK